MAGFEGIGIAWVFSPERPASKGNAPTANSALASAKRPFELPIGIPVFRLIA